MKGRPCGLPMMQDRMMRCGLAGALGGAVSLSVSFILLGIFHIRRLQWIRVVYHLIMGAPPTSSMALMVGFFLYFLWMGWIGALFTLLGLPRPGRGNYLLRGVSYGWVGWAITFTLGTIFRVSALQTKSWQRGVTAIVAQAIWGLVLGYLMWRWDSVYERCGDGGSDDAGDDRKAEGQRRKTAVVAERVEN